MKKLQPYTVLALLVFVLSLAFAFTLPQNTSALSGADFNAGRIIDDSIFYDANSMNVSQIQQFLNSKVPICDTNGTSIATDRGSNLTRAQYANYMYTNHIGNNWEYWHQPPYTCLKDYQQNVPQMEAASGLCGGISNGTRTSAQIIKTIADACGINPQVLLVLLEKEQSLVTDVWPLQNQYNKATGFDCPDSAPCDPAYAGFFYQVYYAARQFKVYQAYPQNYNYVAGRTNRIYYNPDLTRCGSSQVYIENQATAALYIYTPYRPNQAALDNLNGTGDSCSAYGNRNFWRLFSSWFGSTTVPRSNTYIAEGTYTLFNTMTNKVVDVAGSNTADGTNVWLYERNNSPAQNWQISRNSDGYYSLKNIGSGKYLDVAGASKSPGANVQIWTGNEGCAQKWAAIKIGAEYSFVNACGGYALDIANSRADNGTNIQVWNRNNSGAQIWSLVATSTAPVPNGFYEITTTSNLAIDIIGGSTVEGTKVQIWSQNQSSAQTWQVNRQQDGLYTIRNPISGKYLDVIDASTASAAGIQIWNAGSTCAQRWAITKNPDGSYGIRSACSGLALDIVNGAVSTQGSGIQLWESNTSDAQKLKFNKLASSVVPDATYAISTPAGKSLDIIGGTTTEGARIQIWDKNQTPAQTWQVTKQPDGTFLIKNPASGKLLDIIGASTASGAGIQLWNSNGGCGQKWLITENVNSTYTLKSSCANANALDVIGGRYSSAGTGIQTYAQNGSFAQMWTFDAP
ncbi:MAG: RICIN domain-containing protein [Candidatus Microsaccharimonas sp.]